MIRVTIECVPYDSEIDKYLIKTINISEKDYGHLGYGTYSVDGIGEIQHDRRDGHLVLVRKALTHLE